jgi:malate dehydrogenase
VSRLKVSVIGAGQVGATIAQRIAESGLADVTLVDIVEGMPQGKALDMIQSMSLLCRGADVRGSNDPSTIADSRVVVLTAGFPRKPGMSRDELLARNAEIVEPAAEHVRRFAPNSVLVVVTNPLDVMTYLAWKRTGFAPERVVGMAGVLDAARFASVVAVELGISPQDVRCTILGGHGDSMLLLPRYSSVSGIPITELVPAPRLKELVERARSGGAEIVSLLKTGSAFYAPSASVAMMVEAILTDRKRILCASAHLHGQYGLDDIFIGVPVRLGAGGVERIIELPLEKQEMASLRASADQIRSAIKALDR